MLAFIDLFLKDFLHASLYGASFDQILSELPFPFRTSTKPDYHFTSGFAKNAFNIVTCSRNAANHFEPCSSTFA